MIEGAKKLGDHLTVIVNNDVQQMLKKGKIILDQDNRGRLIKALRDVDEAVLSIDTDPSVVKTLERIAQAHPDDELVFANGGDRDSVKAIPEGAVCHEYNIKMIFGVAGLIDSSTRINQALGYE